MKTLLIFLKDVWRDYNTSHELLDAYIGADLVKSKKRVCYKLILKYLFIQTFNAITAPLFYPLWYFNRHNLTLRYADLIISQRVELVEHETEIIWELAQSRLSKFWFFVWTYGDLVDPLGEGGMPDDYKDGKNTFWNRFLYRAIRNPRSIYIHYKQVTDPIRPELIPKGIVTYDTRTSSKVSNYGTGDGRVGTYIRWYISESNKLYFYYERCTTKRMFYLGFCELHYRLENNDWVLAKDYSRFEVSYRECKLIK